MHLVYPRPPPPPTNKQTNIFNFSWVLQSLQEKSKTMVMQNWGGLSFFPPSHCPRDCEGIQHEMLTEDSVVLSPTGDGTAICTVRGHLSHLNIEPFAGQMKYLPLWLFYDRE